MKYEWKRNSLGDSPAAEIAKEIEALSKKNHNKVSPKQIVKMAKNKSSALHTCFIWDDKKAAGKYREDQARYILRNIIIVCDDDDDERIVTRAFVSIQEDDSSYYTTIKNVGNSDDLYGQLLSQAYEDLEAFREKYKKLKELKTLLDSIDGFFDK